VVRSLVVLVGADASTEYLFELKISCEVNVSLLEYKLIYLDSLYLNRISIGLSFRLPSQLNVTLERINFGVFLQLILSALR
jgi:hypothetical protein